MDVSTSGQRPQVLIHDPTLRDGHHAVGHQLDADQLHTYAEAANAAGVPVVEVGHGNGLGASSLQIGRAKLPDALMLKVVREALTNSRMGVFMAPGWGTADDLRAAVAHGADVVRIAAHCTEADVAERHLGDVRDLGAEAQGVLLMSHMASPGQLAEQCAALAKFGAQAVGIMDSAGHYLPSDVAERVHAIAGAVDVPVIFHGHNNLSLAVANSIAAIEAGARIIDATARGFGAGAGNTQLEVLVAVLERRGFDTGIGLREVLHAADVAEAQLMKAQPVIDSVSLVSGLAGVFSGIPAFDLAAGCTGFLYALAAAAGLIAAATAQAVLVIGADRLTSLPAPDDRTTVPLFGDGAGGVVLRRGTAAESGTLGPVLLGSDGTHAELIRAQRPGALRMEGAEVFRHAVDRMSAASRQAAAAAGWALDDFDHLVPHQANARIAGFTARQLGIPDDRQLHNIEHVGNTGAASIPLLLAQAAADGRIKPGHRLLLTAFGAGLTWGATTLTWPDPNP